MRKLSKDKFLLYSIYLSMSASGLKVISIYDILTFMDTVRRDLNDLEVIEINELDVKNFISSSDWAILDGNNIIIKELIFKYMLPQEMEENPDIVLLMRNESTLYWRRKNLCADCEGIGISCNSCNCDLVDFRCKANGREIATAVDVKELRKIPPQAWCPKKKRS